MDFDDVVRDASGPVNTILILGWVAAVAYLRFRRTFNRSIDWPLLVGAWAYLIIGFDLLPERIGLPGLLDDLIVMVAAFVWVYRNSSPKAPVSAQLNRWINDPDQPEPDWYSPGADEQPGQHKRPEG